MKLFKILRTALIIFCGVLFAAASAFSDTLNQTSPNTQDDNRHLLDKWALGGAFSIIADEIEETDDEMLMGPSVLIVRLNPDGLGFDFGLAYLVPAGFYNFTGLAADFTLFYGYPVSNRTMLMIKGGVVGFLGGDSDGSGGGNIAVFPGFGIAQHLTGRLGISADISMRFWLAEESSQTLGARMGLFLTL